MTLAVCLSDLPEVCDEARVTFFYISKFWEASTHFNVLYVNLMIIIYWQEQEAVRGRVSRRQDLGVRFDMLLSWLVRDYG